MSGDVEDWTCPAFLFFLSYLSDNTAIDEFLKNLAVLLCVFLVLPESFFLFLHESNGLLLVVVEDPGIDFEWICSGPTIVSWVELSVRAYDV